MTSDPRTWRAARTERALVLMLVLMAGAAGAPAAPAAQEVARPAGAEGAIAGTVRDSAGMAIAGAEVSVAGSALRAFTDAQGAFRLAPVPPGAATLRVRRLGFHPVVQAVMVEAGASAPLRIVLGQLPQDLAPVVVRAERRLQIGRMAGFNERREHGFGRFITRADIEKRNPQLTTDLLRSIPGVNLTSTRTIQNAVRVRNSPCAPIVWLDGMPLTAAEYDLDFLDPRSIEGIEIYSGVATVPPEFMGTRGEGACGAVVIWSRVGEPRRKEPKKVDVAAQIAALRVFTAEQVDVPARADSEALLAPAYPDSLRREGVSGVVLVEFVVDTTGRVEPGTIGIVSTTHPLFADAVRLAMPDARFHPAEREGHPVRQFVIQPLRFVATREGARP
ncbi:MAG TPA: TonB family protein [Gemmatimonadaceae bacterium]|nr:TonB family protein [Gemmatimonadaceae bacterium]